MELNKVRPSTSHADLCLPFCLILFLWIMDGKRGKPLEAITSMTGKNERASILIQEKLRLQIGWTSKVIHPTNQSIYSLLKSISRSIPFIFSRNITVDRDLSVYCTYITEMSSLCNDYSLNFHLF